MELYEYREPESIRKPILVSVPHSGTYVPEDIRERMVPEVVEQLDDTDWYVEQLYDFVLEMGIPLIKANYSRLVIDLNRDQNGTPLYTDGRLITGLVPLTTFREEEIYISDNPDENEIADRKERYYLPYHYKIKSILEELHNQHSRVLLFDAHSIRHRVPSIRSDPFPDLILSDQDGQCCDQELFDIFNQVLKDSDYDSVSNTIFKGGYITRSFGDPENGINCLQLEMSKRCYMDDDERRYSDERANTIKPTLRAGFEKLMEVL